MAEDETSKMLEGVQSALEKVKEKARSTYFQSTEKEKEKESNVSHSTEKENKVGNSFI